MSIPTATSVTESAVIKAPLSHVWHHIKRAPRNPPPPFPVAFQIELWQGPIGAPELTLRTLCSQELRRLLDRPEEQRGHPGPGGDRRCQVDLQGRHRA